MRRREILTLLGAALVLRRPAYAQSTARTRFIGVLYSTSATSPVEQGYAAVFDEGLRSLGWIPGGNLRVENRWAASKPDRYPVLARELVALAPDLIMASTTVTLMALHRETHTVPIVFTQVSDPIAQGFAASLAHPGGNITGFTVFEFGMGGKWLSLLKEVAPDLARVMFLFNPDTSPQSNLFLRSLEAAAPSVGLAIVAAPIHDQAEIEPAFEDFARQPNGGMVVAADNFLLERRDLVIGLTARYRMPAIYALPEFASSGGLLVYGADPADNWRRAASYVNRILNGEKPGDLPIQQPTKFQLMINIKTAKAFGLSIPQSLLANADEVIE